MTTPVLSDQLVSSAGLRPEFSGSPSNPVHPKLALNSMIFVSTLCLAVGSATMSVVVAGVVVELDPIGTVCT